MGCGSSTATADIDAARSMGTGTEFCNEEEEEEKVSSYLPPVIPTIVITPPPQTSPTTTFGDTLQPPYPFSPPSSTHSHSSLLLQDLSLPLSTAVDDISEADSMRPTGATAATRSMENKTTIFFTEKVGSPPSSPLSRPPALLSRTSSVSPSSGATIAAAAAAAAGITSAQQKKNEDANGAGDSASSASVASTTCTSSPSSSDSHTHSSAIRSASDHSGLSSSSSSSAAQQNLCAATATISSSSHPYHFSLLRQSSTPESRRPVFSKTKAGSLSTSLTIQSAIDKANRDNLSSKSAKHVIRSMHVPMAPPPSIQFPQSYQDTIISDVRHLMMQGGGLVPSSHQIQQQHALFYRNEEFMHPDSPSVKPRGVFSDAPRFTHAGIATSAGAADHGEMAAEEEEEEDALFLFQNNSHVKIDGVASPDEITNVTPPLHSEKSSDSQVPPISLIVTNESEGSPDDLNVKLPQQLTIDTGASREPADQIVMLA